LIIGVDIDDVLTYAVEFDGKTILQAYGKYNENIAEKDMEYIEKWSDKASDFLKNCIYGSFISNPNALAEREEQDYDNIDDFLLDEFEEENVLDTPVNLI
jgi:hypothetical protein